MTNWREFFDRDHALYVNARHLALHNDRIARDIVALIEKDDCTLLDYGCGQALSAGTVAAHCRHLYLYDAAPRVQAQLRAAHSGNARITVLTTDAIDLIPPASIDLVIINSLLQYLSFREFEALLDTLRPLLTPGARLVLADLLPPGLDAVTDARALLHFAWQGGFFVAAIAGLISTFFSSYRSLRQKIGLTHYTVDDMNTLLAAHGYTGSSAPKNLGTNQARHCVIATLA